MPTNDEIDRIADRVLELMTDGRPRTANDIALRVKAPPDLVALVIMRLCRARELARRNRSGFAIYTQPRGLGAFKSTRRAS